MLLFKGTATSFVEETSFNRIVETMISASMEVFGRRPGPAEIHSWQNSLRMMALVTERMGIADSGVAVEYQLPGTSRRLDVMYTGHNGSGIPQAVIVELKQWEKCSAGDGDKVVTFVARRDRDVLHPLFRLTSTNSISVIKTRLFKIKVDLVLDSSHVLSFITTNSMTMMHF